MTCSALKNAASELALDMLTGEERSTAMAHLATCASCRQDVALLTDAADELFVLVPEVEPSAGFEQGILSAIELAAIESLLLVPEIEPPAGFEQRVLSRINSAAPSEPATHPHNRQRRTMRRTLI